MNRSRRTKRLSAKVAIASATAGFRRFPGPMERFEVLWELGGTLVWWPAELTSSTLLSDDNLRTNRSSSHSKPFTATIQYERRGTYSSSQYQVKFHWRLAGSKKLIHLDPRTDEWVPWKFPEEHVDISVFSSTSNLEDPSGANTPDKSTAIEVIKNSQPNTHHYLSNGSETTKGYDTVASSPASDTVNQTLPSDPSSAHIA